MEQKYTVTQAAEILGVRTSVLRYWEEELQLRISRNAQGHRYYTGYDITLLANIKELKKRGLQLKAIKELVPQIARNAPGMSQSKVRLLEDTSVQMYTDQEKDQDTEQEERQRCKELPPASEDSGKILEFQQILERLIQQELHTQNDGEARCRSIDAAIRRQQLARKEAAVAIEKKNKKKHKIHM